MYVLQELLKMQEGVHQREEEKRGGALPVKWGVGMPERMSRIPLSGFKIANALPADAFSIPLYKMGDAEGEEPNASITMTVFLKDTKLRCPY